LQRICSFEIIHVICAFVVNISCLLLLMDAAWGLFYNKCFVLLCRTGLSLCLTGSFGGVLAHLFAAAALSLF
jgi:hypothetical protein